MSRDRGVEALMRQLRAELQMLVAKSLEIGDQRRNRGGVADFSNTDTASFMMLHTVNGFIPALSQLRRTSPCPSRGSLSRPELAGGDAHHVRVRHPSQGPPRLRASRPGRHVHRPPSRAGAAGRSGVPRQGGAHRSGEAGRLHPRGSLPGPAPARAAGHRVSRCEGRGRRTGPHLPNGRAPSRSPRSTASTS